jgi:hypothetical protein
MALSSYGNGASSFFFVFGSSSWKISIISVFLAFFAFASAAYLAFSCFFFLASAFFKAFFFKASFSLRALASISF